MSDRLFAIEIWLDGSLSVTSYDTDLAGAKAVARAWVKDSQPHHDAVEVRVYEMTLLAAYGSGSEPA